MSNEIRVGFDYSHNNMLTFEASSYADFIQFLFASGYKLGKIEAGFYSLEKLEEYDVIIMSTPRNMELNPIEIEIIEDYVKKGGGLLIVSSRGGDHLNKTNLNDLCQKFGFRFESDEINDSVNYMNLQKRPLISKFRPHFISDQVHNVVFSSACSLSVLDFLEDDKFLRITEIVKSGLNTWRNRFDGTDWIEEDSPKIPLLVATEYHKGKVVAFGTLSIFSSLNREYGFAAYDNDVIIANILTWLTTDVIGEGKVITVDLSLDLFHWADYLIKEEDWENFSDLINASMNYFKDNYKKIMEDIDLTREENLEKKKAHVDEIKKMVEANGGDPSKSVPERRIESLQDIMSELSDITGEKYELSIDVEDEGNDQPDEKTTKLLDELPEDLTSLTVKELKTFCKKHDIELPNNARKAVIIEKINYILHGTN